MNRLALRPSIKAPAKITAKTAAIRKPASPTNMFTFGDLANPVGTEPFILCARTEESAKILAKCKISLKFKTFHLIFRGLEQCL